MTYDPFLRRKRTINDPINPIPNYIPPMGSGAAVAQLDEGVQKQAALNRSLFSPGGLAPYYGGTSYTQAAQASTPMKPMFSGGMPILARRPVAPTTPVPQDESAFFADSGTSAVSRPAENAIQRWQGGTSLDQRPGVQPDFTAGQLRRIYTGRIGGTAMPSPRDRPLGFTPQTEWEDQFKPRLRQATPGSARGANGRAPYLWET